MAASPFASVSHFLPAQGPSNTGTRPLSRPTSPAVGTLRVGAKPGERDTGRPSVAAAVGIALASTAGVAFIVAFVYWRLRFRRCSRSRRSLCNCSKRRRSPTAAVSSIPLASSTTLSASPDDMLLIAPPRVQERKLLLAKISRSPRSDTRECEWTGHPPWSLRSSIASATEMASSCLKPLSAREQETRSPSTLATPALESSAKPGQSTRSSPSFTTGGPQPTAARFMGSSAGRDHTMNTYPHARRQYHLPFEAAGLAWPGPPPNQALPPTPRDAQCTPPAFPTLRRGQADSSVEAESANSSQAPGSARKTKDISESTASPPVLADVGADPAVTATTRRTTGALSSPVLGEGELERLGGSYK